MEDSDDVRAQGAAGDPMRYASAYHAPVLYKDVLDGLVTDRRGLYVDGTLGGGGHTAALLEHLASEGRVIGVDQDADALAEAGRRLAAEAEQGRFIPLRGNFGDLERLLADQGVAQVDGILLDLGISSHQVDRAERGFSYVGTGALDMRMDRRGGLAADEIVNRWSPSELRRVLHAYGEEPKAGRIARAIVEARPLETTVDLARVVRAQVRQQDELKTLSRVFQALRIAVNGELERLEQALAAAQHLLRPGGRLAVISYHSLEDRRVKRFLRYGNLEGKPVRDFYGNLLTPWRDLTRKPIMPGEAEVQANPRARSARLRLAERIQDDT